MLKALRAEREGRKAEKTRAKEAEAERDALAEKLTAAETERDEAKGKIDKITNARAHDLRVQVATDAGLDPAIAPRLTGSNREELEADARSLVAAVSGSADYDGGARTTPPKKGTPEQELARTMRSILSGDDPNDPDSGLWEGE